MELFKVNLLLLLLILYTYVEPMVYIIVFVLLPTEKSESVVEHYNINSNSKWGRTAYDTSS